MPFLMLIPYFFNYCIFAVCFIISKCDAFNFVLLQFFLFIWIFCVSKCSLDCFFSTIKKCHWDFDRDCFESIDHFG